MTRTLEPTVGVRRGYDLGAPWYDAWDWQEFWTRNEAPLVKRWLRKHRPERILDVGSGTGTYLATAVNMGLQPVGVDISRGMLMQSRHRACRPALVQADARSLPLSSDTFDAAIIARVLSHVRRPLDLLREVRRCTVNGASVLVTDVSAQHDYDLTHFPAGDQCRIQIETFKHSTDELVKIARSAGFNLRTKRVMSASDALWLPPSGLKSIDRSGHRPISVMLDLEATTRS